MFRFSGITAADMKGVRTDIRGVQAVMLSMISDQTILMGHSLESDLIALKVGLKTLQVTQVLMRHKPWISVNLHGQQLKILVSFSSTGAY